MNFKIILAIIGTTLLIFVAGFTINKSGNTDEKSVSEYGAFIFSYPEGDIDFAGEIVPDDNTHFFNVERFDKEYLVTGYNFYQLFLYIKRAPLYLPYIEKRLKEEGIPDDFKYLAVAESGLRNNALSTASAAGIWQFIPETATRFGLIINSQVDERYNFEKSTEAAIEYFKFLYEKFGNRTLVAAAYNRGEGGIERALSDQEVDSYYDLYLNEETSRYVFRIISIKYIMQNVENSDNLKKLIGEPFSIPDTETITVFKIDNLQTWAKEHNQNIKIIKLLNPWIIGNSLPKGEWDVKIVNL